MGPERFSRRSALIIFWLDCNSGHGDPQQKAKNLE
jgi:hypothetical protein